jgi:UDP-N-acetylglucosamine 1-carboxyvinyltransferase
LKRLVVKGGTRLNGRVTIGGAKNAVLAVMPAALLAEGETIIENAPVIKDVQILSDILSVMGARVTRNGTGFKINPAGITSTCPPFELAKKLRASSLFLGPLLARYGRAVIALPGGCNIGSRPLDQHIKGLEALGARVELKHGHIEATAKKLRGNRVYLDVTSVGATENIMMAAALAEGQTVIENAAKEPEIVNLANLLNAMGCRVMGAGTDIIKIKGAKKLQGVRHTVIPDRIEAGTFMIAAAATDGDVWVEEVIPEHLEPLIAKLREAGFLVEVEDERIRVRSQGRAPRALDIKTLPYPGFPTDLQSPMTVLLTRAKGTSFVKENIFENRFQHVDELRRMGAQIKVEGRTAVVEGETSLSGSKVKATDLRAGAALIIAGVMATAETEIYGIEHIYRGYENITAKFRSLGAEINEVDE